MKNVLKNKRGITLISLVVTIVVLIILATISVTLVLGDNGILTQAKKARDSQANAIVKENQDMDRLLAQYNSELGIAKNPYEPDAWEYAWVYDNGEWGEMLTKGDKIEGGIAAKFYKTGKKVDPPEHEELGDLPEGDEYHLIIELIDGDGEMGVLLTADDSFCAWNLQIQDFMSGSATTYIGAYVTEMVVCEGITNIGEYCETYAFTLKKVIIADTVTSIGDYAFCGCSSLTSITIPDSVTSIGATAFEACSGLTSITIPNSVTSIGEGAFRGCSSLTSLTLGNSVTSIGNSTFEGCSSLTSITLGNSITSIGVTAFADCVSLSNITIPNSVTSIGEGAFFGCSSLTSITLGNSVISIGATAFEKCSGLTSITIPNSVTSIGVRAFDGCSSLTSITIPNSVTSIENTAFWECESLAKVKFLTTDATKITFGPAPFYGMPQDSKIYVLSEDMKTKLEGTYDASRTTVEVVSAERMEEL